MKKLLTSALFIFFAGTLAHAQDILAINSKKPEISKAPEEKCSLVKAFDIRIMSNVISASAMINVFLQENTDSLRLELFNNNGDVAALLFDGSLSEGPHQFKFVPEGKLSRPFIAVFSIAGEVKSMRVVKFNSF